MQIVYLDILQTSDWLIPFFQSVNEDSNGNSLEDESLNMYFENSGFSSMYMFLNLGSTFVYIIGFLVLLILYLFLAMLAALFDW
jgi:hypothetical protein